LQIAEHFALRREACNIIDVIDNWKMSSLKIILY
jgi:hypothetical protein